MASSRAVTSAVAGLLLIFGPLTPCAVQAQDLAPKPMSTGSTSPVQMPFFTPEFSKGQEFLLSGVSAGLFLTGALLPIDNQVVPLEGLDPTEIAWSVDRDIVGNRDASLHDVSDWTRDSSLLLPFIMGLAVSPSEDRWGQFGRRSAVYGEAFLLNLGVTVFLKTTLGRPRPFAYLTEGLRPDHSAYDIAKDRTFRSMPSGHSSTAWTGATLTMTEHLLSRPEAGGLERFGVGLAAATLASVTSSLRSASGQHFPSDVIAGAGIGVASGVIVPLLHNSGTPAPPAAAWLQMGGGTVAGIVLGVLLAR